MKAVVWKDFGSIGVCDVPEPTAGSEEVLVRVKAATICMTDVFMIEAGILGVKPPIIVGHEVSGVIEGAGRKVKDLSCGQLVVLNPPVPCRKCRICKLGISHMCPNTRHIGVHAPGGMAELITIDYRNAYPVPEGVSAEAASLAEPFAVCTEAISQAGGADGKIVCVFGDGTFGLISSLLLKKQKADEVLLFGHHESRMELVKDCGVLTFNSRKVNVEASIKEHSYGYGAQAIIDTTGAKSVLDNACGYLMPKGVLVLFAVPEEPPCIDWEKMHIQELAIVGSCRSLDLFPTALESIKENTGFAERLISRRLSIDEAELGFELIQKSKDEIIKATIVFESGSEA